MSGSNGSNGKGQLAKAQALTTVDAARFMPTGNDWAVFDAYLSLQAERKPRTLRNIAHLAGITHQAVALKFRRPDWLAWWQGEMQRRFASKWAGAMLSQATKAEDDLQAFKAVADVLYQQREQNAPAGQQATNNGVVLHIHGLTGQAHG